MISEEQATEAIRQLKIRGGIRIEAGGELHEIRVEMVPGSLVHDDVMIRVRDLELLLGIVTVI